MKSRGGRWLLNGFVSLAFLFLILPLIIVFPISVSSAQYLQFPPPGFSWQWFERYFDSPSWIDSTVRSLQVAALTTVLSLALGLPLAFALTRGRWTVLKGVEQIIAAPIIAPTIIISVALYSLFAKLRLIGEWYGIALAHTMLALPFIVIVIGAGLRTFDYALEQAAVGLGASRLRAIWRITLPQIRPSIVSAAFLAFITSFDELVVAMFLGGANMTLPKKMFDNIMMEIDPTIAAISVLQILFILAALLISLALGGRGNVLLKKGA